MKKIISLLLAAVMALSMAACNGTTAEETTEATTEAVQPAGPASALEVLEKVWADYSEEEKFSVIGGNMESPVDNAPGNYDMAYAENLTYNLLVPAEELVNVTEAATMIHMMNANTFTGGVVRLAESADLGQFVQTMRSAILNNQWICGFPDMMLIASIGGEYVVVAFGVKDAMEPFADHLASVYPEVEMIFAENID